MEKKLLISIFVFLFFLNSVYALSVPPGQENISLRIERGSEEGFHLILKNVETLTTITSSGDIESWITFGGNNEERYTINVLGNQSLEVTVFVPNEIEPADYFGDIRANDEVLSSIKITVTRPIHETIDNLHLQIENVRNERALTQQELDSLKKEIMQKFDEFSQQQKDISSIEAERNNLLQKVSELETEASRLKEQNEEINVVTGDVITNWSSISLSLGIVIGIIVTVLFINRHRIKGRGSGIGIRKKSYKPRYA